RRTGTTRPGRASGSLRSVRAVLDPVDDRLGPLAVRPHLRRGPLDVVLRPAQLELPVVVERPRGARVAVERHADAARVHELRLVRPGPTELDVAVAEEDRSPRLAGEQPLRRLARPRPEGGVVAAEHVLGRAGPLGLGDHGLEGREVAVDVVEDRGGHGYAGAFASTPSSQPEIPAAASSQPSPTMNR